MLRATAGLLAFGFRRSSAIARYANASTSLVWTASEEGLPLSRSRVQRVPPVRRPAHFPCRTHVGYRSCPYPSSRRGTRSDVRVRPERVAGIGHPPAAPHASSAMGTYRLRTLESCVPAGRELTGEWQRAFGVVVARAARPVHARFILRPLQVLPLRQTRGWMMKPTHPHRRRR